MIIIYQMALMIIITLKKSKKRTVTSDNRNSGIDHEKLKILKFIIVAYPGHPSILLSTLWYTHDQLTATKYLPIS